MAIPTFVHAIGELQNPTSPTAQIDALRHLKNEAIGHDEKKEAFISHGIVDVLNQTLASSAKARGKRKTQETNGSDGSLTRGSTWTEEDEVQLQALILLGTLTNAGPALISPILVSPIIDPLVSALSPRENAPKIVSAALRTLVSLAAASRNTHPRAESLLQSPSLDKVYSKRTVASLALIIAQPNQQQNLRSDIISVCKLVAETCSTEQHRSLLLRAGVLDLLAAHVAGYVVRSTPGGRILDKSAVASLPKGPSRNTLHFVFAAITAIIGESKYLAARFVFSPTIIAVLPFQKAGRPVEPPVASSIFPQPEWSLPSLPALQPRDGTPRNSYYSSGAFNLSTRRISGHLDTQSNPVPGSEKDTGSGHESQVVFWLTHVVRSEQGLCRIEAANLLSALVRAGFIERIRDRFLALLVVPPLVSLLEQSHDYRISGSLFSPDPTDERSLIKERAPAALAKLIQNSSHLQKAATDANVSVRVCSLLKQTFEPLERKPNPWTPNPTDRQSETGKPATQRLGPPALRPDLVHKLKIREGALLLLAAIAEKEDKYRRQLTEQNVITCIIESLAPFKDAVMSEMERDPRAYSSEPLKPASVGNSVPVLLAACKAARALSRSISLLRTSLIDAGIAKPIFALLKHPDVSVLIVATDVVCNLVMEFSPMRHDLVEVGAIKTLCEHAHSANSQIRLVSLWALKHLVYQAPNDVKLSCFEELGTGWLIQIINGAPLSSNFRMPAAGGKAASISLGAANAAGERVDMLNPVDEPMKDGNIDADINEDQATPLSSDDQAMNILLTSLQSNPYYTSLVQKHKLTLHDYYLAETKEEQTKTQSDQHAIQCQGLDFVRNLIQGPGAAEMIDNLFRDLGANTVFDILAEKLKSRAAPDASSLLSGATVPLYPPEILQSATLILVHLAAGAPRHRQQLISQSSLLTSLVPLLHHLDPCIRVACVWVVCNLTWVDDSRDLAGAKQRGSELRSMGFEYALRGLLDDTNMDVKERARTAVEQMDQLAEDGSYTRGQPQAQPSTQSGLAGTDSRAGLER